ncbi:THAP domain-containing protein 5 [Myxocyprinus asiaticus]|uniref:THAP domain-containing protein 5 n=1 Tax=Myxocyprinus asiaticus TaxID=70543 RepID=UPI0022215BF2|nr:THAP domain-containing protein 5 [Myxocyprinus asiaticus]
MQTCDFCDCGQDGGRGDVPFYQFPQQEEILRRWITNMGRDAEWAPSESSALCSSHFTPDCFESGSSRLHTNAIPTIFDFTQSKNQKDTENPPQYQEATTELTDSSKSCDCYKRLQATERFYQMKLAAAQLQIKEYKNNLTEESRKATQWQKRAIVLQSAIRAMRQSRSIPAIRKTSTPNTKNVD